MDDLFWTETAFQDVEEIVSYVRLDSPKAAERIARRIAESVSALSYHPRLGRIGRDPTTRELVVNGTPYIAVYRLRERIEILAVLHGARRWPDGFGNP